MSIDPRRCAVVGVGFLGSRLLALLSGARGVELRRGEDAADPSVWEGHPLPERIFCCQSTRGGDAAAYRRAYLGVLGALPGAARVIWCSALSVGAAEGARAEVLRTAEQGVLARGGVVARLAALWGEGRCELLRRHCAGEPRLPGPPQRRLNYVHADDAARALLLLAEAPSGCYDVCGESLTHAEAYAMLEELTGIPAAAQESAAGHRGHSSALPDTAALRALGWQPQHQLKELCGNHAH